MVSVEKTLKNINKYFKECKSPCVDKDIEILIENLKKYGINDPNIPKELKIIWKIASEWHLIEDHYNVFGFNIYNPNDIIRITNDIFGDDNCRKEWLENIGKYSCGNKDWICIIGYSEYDYIFVNLNKNSPFFGSTRHIVNNCTIDEHLTDPSFTNFIDYMQNI